MAKNAWAGGLAIVHFPVARTDTVDHDPQKALVFTDLWQRQLAQLGLKRFGHDCGEGGGCWPLARSSDLLARQRVAYRRGVLIALIWTPIR